MLPFFLLPSWPKCIGLRALNSIFHKELIEVLKELLVTRHAPPAPSGDYRLAPYTPRSPEYLLRSLPLGYLYTKIRFWETTSWNYWVSAYSGAWIFQRLNLRCWKPKLPRQGRSLTRRWHVRVLWFSGRVGSERKLMISWLQDALLIDPLLWVEGREWIGLISVPGRILESTLSCTYISDTPSSGDSWKRFFLSPIPSVDQD